MDPRFSTLFGFTEEKLRKLIGQVVNLDESGVNAERLLKRMKLLYNGYRFSPKSAETHLQCVDVTSIA